MRTSVKKPLLVDVTDYTWKEFETLRTWFDLEGVGHLEGDPECVVACIGTVEVGVSR